MALRELQEDGIDFQAEISAFTHSRCAYHPNYQRWENLFLSHKLVFNAAGQTGLWTADECFRVLAHHSSPALSLFYGQTRLDQAWTAAHGQALATYLHCQPDMYCRFLPDDDQSVLWHNRAGGRALLWNFAARTVPLPGQVADLTTGQALPPATAYALLADHVYQVVAEALPTLATAI